MKTSIVAIVLLTAVMAVADSSSSAERKASRQRNAAARGAGSLSLKGAPSFEGGVARFNVTVTPRGGGRATQGSADVVGFSQVDAGGAGEVEWSVSGSSVTGTLTTEGGTEVGKFEGTLTRTGVSGMFTHRDGRVGLWSWAGPPPARATE